MEEKSNAAIEDENDLCQDWNLCPKKSTKKYLKEEWEYREMLGKVYKISVTLDEKSLTSNVQRGDYS